MRGKTGVLSTMPLSFGSLAWRAGNFTYLLFLRDHDLNLHGQEGEWMT